MSPLNRTPARLLPAALTASLVTIAAPAAHSSAEPNPVPAQRDSIAIDGVDHSTLRSAPRVSATGASGDAVVGMTRALDTQDFRVAGVTWEGDRTDVEAFVRTRDAETGDWTGWSRLKAEKGPDAESAENADARGGTQPLITTASDGIQVRVESEGATPRGLRVDVVDPGSSPADGEAQPSSPGTASTAASEGGASAAVTRAGSTEAGTAARPTVYSRADWAADESIRKGDPTYGEVRGAVVHHTAETNDYTKDEVPALLRGMYDYHVNTRGWDDIGYNVLVDKWGRLWEGRAGGLDRAVTGAHASGVNSETFGISAMGNYDTAEASDAMVTSIERFVAWKLGVHDVDPTGTAIIGGEERPTVTGHRDVGQTVCPGQYLYPEIPGIRTGAKERQS